MSRPSARDSAMPSADANRGEAAGLPDRQPEHVPRGRAEGHAHADLVRALRDEVGHHAVDTDHRQQQRQAAERQHDAGDVLQPDRALAHHLAEGHYVEHRLRGVDRAQRGSRVGHERCRIVRRPHEQRHAAGGRLRERPVHRRVVPAGEPVVDDVTRDPDNRQPVVPHLDTPAERVLTRPVPLRQRLADHGDRLRLVAVARVEPRPRRIGTPSVSKMAGVAAR